MQEVSVRVSALDEVGDRDAPIGSRPWAVWIVGQARLQREYIDRDASLLRSLLVKMQKYEAWKALGFPSLDMLCTTRLNLSADEVDSVLEARRGKSLGAVLRKVGRPKAGDGKPNNIGISYSRTDPAYLAARLRRDHPDAVFDESVRGSVRQAAIEAGIVKVPSVLEKLRKLWGRASEDERRAFLDEVR